MAGDNTFVNTLANCYVDFNGGIEESLMNSGDALTIQSTGNNASQTAESQPGTGSQQAFQRFTSPAPKLDTEKLRQDVVQNLQNSKELYHSDQIKDLKDTNAILQRKIQQTDQNASSALTMAKEAKGSFLQGATGKMIEATTAGSLGFALTKNPYAGVAAAVLAPLASEAYKHKEELWQTVRNFYESPGIPLLTNTILRTMGAPVLPPVKRQK